MTNFDKPKLSRRGLLSAAAIGLLSLGVLPAEAIAQNWPSGTVQLNVPARAGGGTDNGARVLGGALQEAIGKPVAIVNNPGGGGAVAAEQVRTSDPDGQMLLFYHGGFIITHVMGGYDHSPIEDFTTVASLPVGGSFAIGVKADSPYQTLPELVAAAKENPNKVTLGVQLRGGSHFMAGLLAQDSGAEFRIVEAGGDSDKHVALQGGQIDAAVLYTGGALPYVESGDVRLLATIAGSPERDPGASEYPSMAELGYENSVYGTDFLILGPKGMDPADVEKINAAVGEVLAQSEISDQLAKMRLPIRHTSVEEGQVRIKDTHSKVVSTAKSLGLID